ncbi:hypothetical protein [Pseudomonas knackmussii]|uniref:hypothetical protein n=1 Tax=Pseudomonas knackmussii TaxID=65741 RepID=UPI003F49F09C
MTSSTQDTKSKRVALITTWGEVCGIAHYSAFLKKALDPYADITVLPTPREVFFGATTKHEIKAADDLTDEIAVKASQFDATCIQFEPGLFGRSPRQSLSRVKRIIAGSNDVIMAFHHFQRSNRHTLAEIMHPLRPKAIARNLIRELNAIRQQRLWDSLWLALNNHAKHHHVTLIAHTKADARYLKFNVPNATIVDGPLTYMDDAYIAGIDELAKKSNLANLIPRPKENTRYLGVFGFYGEYKGFETAINTLKHLPENFELLMFSGVHPSTLTVNQSTPSYLAKLMGMVERKKKLLSRVHFIGSVSDDDMLLGMMLSDAVIIPYINSVHTSSGPASQAIELDRPSYMSRNRQFNEFSKYFPNQFEFFDIGNYIELAQKILRNDGKGKYRTVNDLRLVEFPKRERPITVEHTISNYLIGIGAKR